MAYREYVGSRYVPIFGRKDETSIDWDNSKPYEPLTIVLYQGNSYTSRQYVPIGVDIDNSEYWAKTGNYNAQIDQYRQEVSTYNMRIETLEGDFPVTSANIADGAVIASKIATGAVESSKIANGAVESSKIANGAVTVDKIANSSVESSKIANGAVGASQIANGAVGASQIANGAVESSKIANGAVGSDQIAQGAITADKIDSSSVSQIVTINGTISNISAGGIGTLMYTSAQLQALGIADVGQWCVIGLMCQVQLLNDVVNGAFDTVGVYSINSQSTPSIRAEIRNNNYSLEARRNTLEIQIANTANAAKSYQFKCVLAKQTS